MSERQQRLERPGDIIAVGGKVFGVCAECLKVVRLDKPLFGNLHVCAAPPPGDTHD